MFLLFTLISSYFQSVNQITELYELYLKKRNITTKTEILSKTFDAVWASLMALEKAKKLLPPGVELTNFDYKNTEITQILQTCLRSVDFLGMSVSKLCIIIFRYLYSYLLLLLL